MGHAEIDAVLAHELAHLRRRDPLMHAACSLLLLPVVLSSRGLVGCALCAADARDGLRCRSRRAAWARPRTMRGRYCRLRNEPARMKGQRRPCGRSLQQRPVWRRPSTLHQPRRNGGTYADADEYGNEIQGSGPRDACGCRCFASHGCGDRSSHAAGAAHAGIRAQLAAGNVASTQQTPRCSQRKQHRKASRH